MITQSIYESLEARLKYQGQNGERISYLPPRVDRFSNDNIQVQVPEHVRGNLAIVVQTQVPPVDHHLIELFFLLDALKSARCEDVLLVFPYMPYARSDRKNQPRISVGGRTIARILSLACGVRRVLLLDPHSEYTKHYLEDGGAPPADEVKACFLMTDYMERKFFREHPRDNCVIVFPDAGAQDRYGDLLDVTGLAGAVMHKERKDNTENPVVTRLIGNVRDKVCIMFDDEILTGGTLVKGAEMLLQEGAREVCAFAIHGVLEDQRSSAFELIRRLDASPISHFVVTDSVPVTPKLVAANSRKFDVIPVGSLLAEAIWRIIHNESVSDLHDPANVGLYRS